MSVFVPVQGKTPEQLAAATRPSSTMIVRAPLYDTQVIAGTQIVFFNAINNDKTLSNARGNGGALPQGTYFEPLWINVDYLAVNVLGANTALGRLNDIDLLVGSGRGTLTITIGQTSLPQIPLSYCHASGGPTGTAAATLTAPAQLQYGTNGVQDSGYCIAGSFTLTPNTSFYCTVNWTVAPVLAGTTPMLRVSFDGNWYLPISG